MNSIVKPNFKVVLFKKKKVLVSPINSAWNSQKILNGAAIQTYTKYNACQLLFKDFLNNKENFFHYSQIQNK